MNKSKTEWITKSKNVTNFKKDFKANYKES